MARTVDQAFWYPSSMLEDMQALASRRKKDLAWVVEQAWSVARAEVATLDGNKPWRAEASFDARYADSDKHKRMLALSAATVDEIRLEAARLDRSMSWLVARCWCVASDALGQSKSTKTGA